MKIKLFVLSTLMFTMLGLAGYAQGNQLNLTNTIQLVDSNKEQSIKVEISGNIKDLKIEASCSIEQGEVSIQLFDPQGKNQGKFTVGSADNIVIPSKDNKMGSAEESGRMEKRVKLPENGTWIVKVTSKNAKGYVTIRSRQIFE